MGMDVKGRKPKDNKGEYFRANVWSWRPIHFLMDVANSLSPINPIVNEDLWKAMEYNDGAGLDNQNSCDRLADAFEKLLNNPKTIESFGLVVSKKSGKCSEMRISFPVDNDYCIDSRDGHFVKKGETIPNEYLISPYCVNENHLREFIEFLRSCGGFSVF
jgi:hypothetical protein